MWKKFLRNYFTFNKRERNGLIVLLLIMAVITFWPAVYKWWHKDPPVDFLAFQQAIDSFGLQTAEGSQQFGDSATGVTALAMTDRSSSPTTPEEHPPFPFNPNTLDEAGWKKLGVPEKNVRTILKYRAKGGKFFRKEDLKKIYGFSESDFNRLEPYIAFNQQTQFIAAESKEVIKEAASLKKVSVQLNTADSIELVSLNGIGPVLSSRIIKYRNRLGGYVSLEQLLEVYGLSPESYADIKDQLSVDAAVIQKIAINEISLNDLKQHPYFRNPLASMVINYRNQHGPFDAPEKLKNVELINDSVYKMIIPYVKF